jgi:GTP diphosphokinase / guanosine-3',5'-bis(diphosphate) 3'-diphosphatase
MSQELVIQDEDKILIQRAYRNLLRSLKDKMSDEDRKNIRLAYEMAVDAHSKQRRKSGEPYILHPIEVARICIEEIGLGPTAAISALLHDVVEDTDITLTDIKERFGVKISKIVDGLTKLDHSYDIESTQAENFRKVLSTLVEDVRVVLIKMADRLHNMRTLGSMPRHKQLKIAAETSYIYAPLAHRLGLYNLKIEFTDLCMKITEPDAYREIAQKLQATKKERTAYINEFVSPLKEAINELNIPCNIIGRPKSIYSIWNKIKTKKIPFEEIYDLFAIRIILDVPLKQEKSACWQVYSVVTDVFHPIPERLKDWITTPKSNGYESLHTTVIGPKGRYVEVQIRSERMDEVAERGFAAHWKYKGVKTSGQDVYDSWLDNIRDILDDPDKDALEFITDFKNNLFHEEVYVYTPVGEMKVLPKGATALDFAFNIHTDIGFHASAIKVNNKLVPMGYKLENGDQITVTTNKNQRPGESWLKMVVTSKAKSKIRTALKEENKKRSEYGKEALERKLGNMRVDFEENVDFLVKYFGFKSRFDLYFAISTGEINLIQDMKKFLVENGKLLLASQENFYKPDTDVKFQPRPSSSGESGKKSAIIINGEPGEIYNYSLANCCNPVQGDDIFAFITTSAGVKIHRTTCPNAMNLMANYGYRIMKADWNKSISSDFVAELVITGIDSGPGVIKKLTDKISSSMGLNIRSFAIEGKEGYFEGKVSLIVKNKDQLHQVIRLISQLEGISNVSRVE